MPGKTDEMTQFLRQGGSYELTCPTTASLDGAVELDKRDRGERAADG